ncbi:MAG: hypothetical protein WCK84_02135 [Bacteroidota bacterium]
MKNDFISRNKEFFYLAFIIMTLITFFPLFFTGFATADDLHYYLITRRGQIMADTSFFARVAGRFYFYIVRPVYSLPYLFGDSMVIVKIFQYVPLIVCFLLFAKIVFDITKSKAMAWLFLLIFLMTMQISQHTSLFVSYPFYFTFSFSLLLISYLLILRFYEQRKNRLILFAAVFFAIGLLFYETYIFFLLFAGLTMVFYNLKEKNPLPQTIKNSIVQFLPFLAIGVIYLAAYFIFRIYHPSQYPGTNFEFKDLSAGTFFMVLWNLAYSSFPLTVYETTHGLFWDKSELISGYSPVVMNLIFNARLEWIVKGILISFLGYKLLMTTPSVKLKGLLAGAIISLLLIFLPQVPLALTEKYIAYAGHGTMIGYVTTFFSFFGTLLLMTLLLSYLMNLFNFSKIFKQAIAAVFVFGFFICSVVTDFSNYSIAKDIGSANLRLLAVDELLKSDEFKTIPSGTPFFARDLWDNPSYCARGITEQEFNWYEYFEAKSGLSYLFGREVGRFLDYSKNVKLAPYYITMRQAEKTEDILLVMGQMAPLQPQDSVINHFADRATIAYYSSYKIFTVSFKVKSVSASTNVPIKINHIIDEVIFEKTIEITIYNTKKSQPATIFSVQFPGIDLSSIIISNMINPKNKYFYL